MITTPTVFVLGAGASKPYNFPIGTELRALVIQGLADGQSIWKPLTDFNLFSQEAIAEFRLRLLESSFGSVDAFLGTKFGQNFIDIGKAAMAVVLIGLESPGELFGDRDANWFRYIWPWFGSEYDQLAKNRVSFITFNYDRSLETFLFKAISSAHGQPPTEAIMQSFNIIHLHGRLGPLPWQDPNGRDYIPLADARAIEMCVRDIKVVHDDVDEVRDTEFQRAKRLLTEAERVYCLGFGFGSQNTERLSLRELPTSRIVATISGMTDHEGTRIRKALGNAPLLLNTDCIGLLRNYVELD